MGDGELLLRAVIDHPDEDKPRLVYADWLEEDGQGDRAEFVRVQVELGRRERAAAAGHKPQVRVPRGVVAGGFGEARYAGTAEEVAPLAVRERRLWVIGRGWASPFHGAFDWFRRGFVEGVECPAATWLAHADAVLAAHPVRRVTLTTVPYIVWVETARRRLSGRRRVVDFGSESVAGDGHIALAALLRAEWPGVTFTIPTVADEILTGLTGYAAALTAGRR